MWLALPSPSGSPTTRLVPTSRMISSAIASGSENIFGIKRRPGCDWKPAPGVGRWPPAAIAYLPLIFVCDEPATAAGSTAGLTALASLGTLGLGRLGFDGLSRSVRCFNPDLTSGRRRSEAQNQKHKSPQGRKRDA